MNRPVLLTSGFSAGLCLRMQMMWTAQQLHLPPARQGEVKARTS